MKEWTLHQAYGSFQSKKLHPLYLFYGEESFLIDEALRQIRSVALTEGIEDFNCDVFYAAGVDIFQVKDSVETLPMMSPYRVVILKETQELKDKDWQALEPLLLEPIDSTVFVLTATKVDKRKRSYKNCVQHGAVVEVKRLYDQQVSEWIEVLAKRQGLSMEHEAVSLIHQLVGNNLSELQSEIIKVAQFLGDRRDVRTQDILQVVSKVRMESVFELTAAIGSQDEVRALMCLVQLLENGQNEVGVLSLITRHLRILKSVKQGLREGLTGPKLSARVGVPSYFIRPYMDQAKQWSEKKLENGFRALLDTDRALKSSPLSSHIWLENFVLQACS